MFSKEEWVKRYADQIQRCCSCEREFAEDCAQFGWGESDQSTDNDCPENCADEEMSCWEPDES